MGRSHWHSKGYCGYPPPEKQQPAHSQLHAAPSNLVPPQEATSSTMPMPSTQQVVFPSNVLAPDAMEVGRSKRGWESSDGSMHDGEFASWSVVHDEVLQQLSDHDLVGPAYQQGAAAVDPGC